MTATGKGEGIGWRNDVRQIDRVGSAMHSRGTITGIVAGAKMEIPGAVIQGVTRGCVGV